MLSSWQQKEHDGATRLACAACGAHTLVTDAYAHAHAACNCCGGLDLRPVAAVEAQRHAGRARRHSARGRARRGNVHER